MTFHEYIQIISDRLEAAYNNKADIATLQTIFKMADQTLKSYDIGPDKRKEFWESVHKNFSHPHQRGLIEKQENSALIALMQAIENELAARTGTSK